MQTAAVTGTAAAFGGIAGADRRQAQPFELGGRTQGWEGRAPDAITDETNPTLELETGQTYVVIWENLDGAPHDFTILDADGNELQGTETMNNEGETRRLEFEATEEMAEYYCSVHPGSMRGDIQLAGQDGGDGGGQGQQLIPTGPTVGLATVAEGLTSPVGFEVAPEDQDRRFIVDQTGQIYVHGPNGLQDQPFMDISDRIVELGVEEAGGFDERGLLGLAFHPDFSNNRRFFVRYSAPRGSVTPATFDHTFVLAEFQASEDLSTGNPDSERRLLQIPQPQFNHNAGPIAFGPDGFLYVTVGDGGGADDNGMGHTVDWYAGTTGGNGQNTVHTLLGGILRIDVDNQELGNPYAIPDDNPFAGTVQEDGGEEGEDGGGGDGGDGDRAPKQPVEVEGLAEYYAWGMRNPWGMSFTDDGQLLAADVGQNLLEEINHVQMGGNYGWNVKEGTHCFSTEDPSQPPMNCPSSTAGYVRGGEELTDPVIEYPHQYGGETIGISIIAGHMYNGSVSALQGSYVFGDWSTSFQEPGGSIFVSTPPEGWPDGGEVQQSLADQTDMDSDIFQEELWENVWGIEEVQVQGEGDLVGDDGQLNRFILAFGEDANGEVYVLTTQNNTPTGNTGAVHRIVSGGGGGGGGGGDGGGGGS